MIPSWSVVGLGAGWQWFCQTLGSSWQLLTEDTPVSPLLPNLATQAYYKPRYSYWLQM